MAMAAAPWCRSGTAAVRARRVPTNAPWHRLPFVRVHLARRVLPAAGYSGNPRGRACTWARPRVCTGRPLHARARHAPRFGPRLPAGTALLSRAMRRSVLCSVLGATALAACAPERGSAPPGVSPAQARAPLALEHDFGVVPHGASRVHEFVLDLARLPERWVPLRTHLECSCGHADLRLRRPDGSERLVDHSGSAANLPGPDESLVLRVELQTKMREPIDLAPTLSRGYVTLQLATDVTGTQRIQWPFSVRFGIDAPVDVRPFASLDFGKVPASQRGSVTTTLRGDERHADAVFGPVTASDPAVAVELERADGHWLMRATCTPQQPGSARAIVTVATTIPGYTLELAATWKAVPDLEATPLAKVSFRAALARAQTEDEIVGQFVLLTDHDRGRPPEFEVQRIVDGAGRDLSPHFAVTFAAVPDSPRQHRMFVRYTGGLSEGVRGSIVLTKDGDRGPFLPIELAVFPAKDA